MCIVHFTYIFTGQYAMVYIKNLDSYLLNMKKVLYMHKATSKLL